MPATANALHTTDRTDRMLFSKALHESVDLLEKQNARHAGSDAPVAT